MMLIGEMMRAGRFVGFLLAGGTATALNYAVFAVLLLAGVHHLAAATTGYLTGIALSYAINLRLVFRDAVALRARAPRYVAAYLAALLLQLILLEALVRGGMVPLVANALALLVVVTLNYLAISRFVFPDREQ